MSMDDVPIGNIRSFYPESQILPRMSILGCLLI